MEKKGSHLLVNNITAVVSSITDNLGRLFSGFTYTCKLVNKSVTNIWEILNNIYSYINDISGQLCVPNIVGIMLYESLSNVEQIIHNNVLKKIQDM